MKAHLLCQRVSLRTSSGVARDEKFFSIRPSFLHRFSPLSSMFQSCSHHFPITFHGIPVRASPDLVKLSSCVTLLEGWRICGTELRLQWGHLSHASDGSTHHSCKTTHMLYGMCSMQKYRSIMINISMASEVAWRTPSIFLGAERSAYDVSMDLVRTSVTLRSYAPSALADGASLDEKL